MPCCSTVSVIVLFSISTFALKPVRIPHTLALSIVLLRMIAPVLLTERMFEFTDPVVAITTLNPSMVT